MQLVFNENPPGLRAGMIADSRILRHVNTKIGSGNVKAGLGVFRVPGLSGPGNPPKIDPGLCYQNPSPSAAVDVDAIVTTHATATDAIALSGADFNGAQAGAEVFPPRKITITLNSNANWDATELTAVFIGADNLVHTETIAIPDGGNTTLTTTGYAKQPISFTIDAQAGTGGSFTIGYAALDSSMTINDFLGVAVYDSATVETRTDNSDLGEYRHADTIPVLKIGAIVVETEGTISDQDPVYVRVASGSGGSQLGKFRNTDDTSTAVLVPNARFERDSSNGALNVVAFYS